MGKHRITTLISLTVVLACASAETEYLPPGYPDPFHPTPDCLFRMGIEWALQAAGEPPLLEIDSPAEVHRFIHHPSLSNTTYLSRLDVLEDEGHLVIQLLSYDQATDEPIVDTLVDVRMTEPETESYLSLVAEAGFWRGRTEELPQFEDAPVYYLEAIRGGVYQGFLHPPPRLVDWYIGQRERE